MVILKVTTSHKRPDCSVSNANFILLFTSGKEEHYHHSKEYHEGYSDCADTVVRFFQGHHYLDNQSTLHDINNLNSWIKQHQANRDVTSIEDSDCLPEETISNKCLFAKSIIDKESFKATSNHPSMSSPIAVPPKNMPHYVNNTITIDNTILSKDLHVISSNTVLPKHVEYTEDKISSLINPNMNSSNSGIPNIEPLYMHKCELMSVDQQTQCESCNHILKPLDEFLSETICAKQQLITDLIGRDKTKAKHELSIMVPSVCQTSKSCVPVYRVIIPKEESQPCKEQTCRKGHMVYHPLQTPQYSYQDNNAYTSQVDTNSCKGCCIFTTNQELVITSRLNKDADVMNIIALAMAKTQQCFDSSESNKVEAAPIPIKNCPDSNNNSFQSTRVCSSGQHMSSLNTFRENGNALQSIPLCTLAVTAVTDSAIQQNRETDITLKCHSSKENIQSPYSLVWRPW